MPDLWFVLGLALGIAVTGFSAVGAFDPGRRRAVIASRSRITRSTYDEGRLHAQSVTASPLRG